MEWTAHCGHCGAAFTASSLADKTCSDGCFDNWLLSLEVPGPSQPYIRDIHNRMRRERGIPERPLAAPELTHIVDTHPNGPEW